MGCGMQNMETFDVVIIGAGAAGLMCAIEAGKRGRSVLIIDHASKPAEKIRISGGGRCNFTNIHATPKQFISQNPHFCVSALKRYPAERFIALVESHGIRYHEKTLGQLFCDDSAQQIIRMLLDECKQAGVVLRLETAATKIRACDGGYRLMAGSELVECQSLVIATGGLSIPKMGATGFGYQVAKQFEVNVTETRAGLVPFTLNERQLEAYRPLAGVSVDPVEVSIGKTSFREAMLMTHRGISGPAMLQISSYWEEGAMLRINLAPNVNVFEWLKTQKTEQPKQELQTTLATHFAKRFAQEIVYEFGLDHAKLADLSHKTLQEVADRINRWNIIPNGTEGYRTAEVTIGGVDTNELSSQTMEAKHVKGLYFIGEVVDVTGWLGGYNFQWAWASGHACGQAC